MNARKTIALFALFGLMIGGSATAAVNNMTSRGGFVPMGSKQAVSRSTASRGFAYRAPAARSQPTYSYSAPAIQTAQAPEEGRRFSYAPSSSATTSIPCPQGQAVAAAPTTDGTRRYSYAPAPESTAVAPAAPAARTYYSRPSYSGGSRSRSTGDNFPLLKTDPRKYNTR